ncbi:MAG: hypothetical protein ABSG77_16340 [Candidatus Acidiferrum sp.]|jgi:hypothetical protein
MRFSWQSRVRPGPATHGQVHIGAANTNPEVTGPQLRRHLAEHEKHLRVTATTIAAC